MKNTVSVAQAAENALVAWIASQLPDVVTNNEWPDPGVPLNKRGEVTILRAGGYQEMTVRPQVVRTDLDPFQIQTTFHWKVSNVEQPMQLDVWATSKAKRDDILNRLGTALTAGPGETLSAACLASYGAQPAHLQNPVARVVLLQLAAPWDHLVASFQFDSPETTDSARASSEREFRATYHGTGFFDRTVPKISARIRRMRMPVAVSPTASPTDATTPVKGTLTVADTPQPDGTTTTTTTITPGNS